MNFYKEILEIILKYTQEGIHVIDKHGNTIIYNKAMANLEGMEEEEVLGKNILEVFPSLNENTSTLLNAVKTGEIIIDRYQTYLNKKGYHITSVNTTLPIIKDGEIVGAVEISKDFTKIKELYDKIIKLTEEKDNLGETTNFSNIIGCSPKFLKAVEIAKKAAKSSSTVLIYGETGTGKEVFARCIHNESLRKDKPFIAVNCAALPESLLEGILFGTVKGGFTGALDRPGLFEQANGGTILLDEINSMPLNLQAKLLRVLQESYIRRIGGLKDIPIDVRVIATINEDPYAAILNGKLRKDLYYRLSVINIAIPPLRERKEDIPLLVNYFIKKYNKELNKNIQDLSKEVYDAFMSYDWPGNVRELKNYLESAMNLATTGLLKEEHFVGQYKEQIFKRSLKSNLSLDIGLNEYLENIEKSLILSALEETNYNITKAAEKLKIKRQTLQHKMKKYKINESAKF
ncbi:arginine utilization regulatory protein [Caloramator fervidus]|uniref:Arginine utilization regulatory protein n=1 Tax=Caloramator fervidus TaxID=29344 RepID=A0A1H5VZX0_9CLOT|nr:sigma 54-interacting transcriptional regulator [Caloramator fervidus]SEF92097.1 arginine utilization regulatory protein [Caloramator fervidus]